MNPFDKHANLVAAGVISLEEARTEFPTMTQAHVDATPRRAFERKAEEQRNTFNSRITQAVSEFQDGAATAVEEVQTVAIEEFTVNSAVVESLGRIEQHRDMLVNGEGRVHPGQPIEMSPAASINDAIAQGDLNLVVRESVPEGYKLRESGDGQLVPGNTTGAKHIVRDVSTVEIYDPRNWGPTYDELNGPYLVTKAPTVIDHPTHGAVTIPAGFTVESRYQRVWDQEQKKARRQRD